MPNERTKYEELFKSLNPVEGKLAGNIVKPIMVSTNLPVELLTRIWDLSDIDQDGFLDLEEFILVTTIVLV